MRFPADQPVFDYKALRLIVGIVAFTLPWIVNIVAHTDLPSISASYFTEARDEFVGMLFVVGSMMLAYNGHSQREAWAAKVASLCAIVIALFPTAKACGAPSDTAMLHGGAALILFSILAWFCFVPFRKNTKGQGGKKGRRAKLYFACGIVMVVAMAIGLIGELTMTCEQVDAIDLIYWIETVALTAWGVAWITSGKIIPALVDEEDALKLFEA